MGRSDLHVQVGIAHGVADLVVGAAGAEHGEAAGEGDVSRGGQAGGHINHVLLGDAAVEQPIGVAGLGQLLGGGGAGQVGVDGDDRRALGGKFRQRDAVSRTGCALDLGLFRISQRNHG